MFRQMTNELRDGLRACIHVCMYMRTHTSGRACKYASPRACPVVCVCMVAYICLYVFKQMRMYMYTCACVCVFAHVYMC